MTTPTKQPRIPLNRDRVLVAAVAFADANGIDSLSMRKLGQELDIFVIDEDVGKGLPLWLPNGAVLCHELEKLARDEVGAELRLDLVLAAESHHGDTNGNPIASLPDAGRDPASPLTPYLDGLFGGDPEAGRRVFEDIELSCLRCHATEGADGEGHGIGPSVDGVGTRLTRLQMLQSIVEPNRTITAGFQGTVLFLVDPETERASVVAGRVIEETADVIRVLDSEGEITEVDPRHVDDRRPDLSAMPEGLADSIDRRAMRDLLAYLASL